MLLLPAGIQPARAATFEGHHLATSIDITCQQPVRFRRSYRQNDHMEAILNYLRLLEYAGMPKDDPELHAGDTYRITVHLADGREHVYHLHADRYLSRDFRPWIKVESERPFSALLELLP